MAFDVGTMTGGGGGGGYGGGTGSKLTRATIIVAGVAALAASLLSIVSIALQLKNYRKPLLQRYVVRILIMVPIYSAASWTSLLSLKAAFYIDPVRDIYEAFTIYTFFQLLINFIGGERALIIMMHGRQPVHHLWPLNHCFGKVDISDPHTFLAIKRGILQYAWIKPILGVATIAMKATDTYQEGYVGLQSGYFWSGIIYNISITLSLYSLGMFWVCMSQDLQPFRPMPKFLCIKLIIFASYWQGFLLSIFVWLGAIPDDVSGYTPDNIAAAIQNALICFEMPAFAMGHWHAFSWHDYADATISAARMPVLYAIRDAFGVRDLIEDTRETFFGKGYEYRLFDTGDDVLGHEESDSRVARMMEGMRYERGGKGKYWIPKPGEANARTPLLGKAGPGESRAISPSTAAPSGRDYAGRVTDNIEPLEIDKDEERLYENARALEFGDWNYPVITANEAPRERWMTRDPGLLTTSTNRHLLQPTKDNKTRRESHIKKTLDKGKHRDSSGSNSRSTSRPSRLSRVQRPGSSSSTSAKSGRSQLVDLVVEDKEAEATERVRARKEGGPEWNVAEAKRFVRTYSDADQGEEIREGHDPSSMLPDQEQQEHAANRISGAVPEGEDEVDDDDDDKEGDGDLKTGMSYGSLNEERTAWGDGGDRST